MVCCETTADYNIFRNNICLHVWNRFQQVHAYLLTKSRIKVSGVPDFNGSSGMGHNAPVTATTAKYRLVTVILYNWVASWNSIPQMWGGCSGDKVKLQKHSKTQVQWKLQNSRKIRGNSDNDICSMHQAPSIQLCLVLTSLSDTCLACILGYLCALWGEWITKGSYVICCNYRFFQFCNLVPSDRRPSSFLSTSLFCVSFISYWCLCTMMFKTWEISGKYFNLVRFLKSVS